MIHVKTIINSVENAVLIDRLNNIQMHGGKWVPQLVHDEHLKSKIHH